MAYPRAKHRQYMRDWRKTNSKKAKGQSRSASHRYRHKSHPATRPMPKHCECCGTKATPLALDHDHETNQFRGWLCTRCNVGIGMLGDSVDGVLNAVKYLSK